MTTPNVDEVIARLRKDMTFGDQHVCQVGVADLRTLLDAYSAERALADDLYDDLRRHGITTASTIGYEEVHRCG